MDLLTTILAGIAGYFAIAWKAEKDKADKRSAKRLEELERWAGKVADKVGVPFTNTTEDD